MKRLIIGPIPTDYDPKFDVPLGINCFAGRENEFDKYEKDSCISSLLYAFPDKVDEVSKEATGYILALLDELKDYLNRENNTDYSMRFWRVYILPWLLYVVHVIVDCYYSVLSAKKYFKDQLVSVTILEKDCDFIQYKSLDDFYYNGILDGRLYYWVTSRIIELMKYDSWVLQYEKTYLRSDGLVKYPVCKFNFKQKLALKLAQYMPVRTGMKISFIFECLCSFILMGKSFLKKHDSSEIKFKYFDFTKSALCPDYVRDVVYELIPKSFKTIPKFSRKIKVSKWYIIGCNLPFIGNERRRLLYAQLFDSGAKVYGIQHGSMYGTSRTSKYLELCDYCYQGFFTWGWRFYNGCDIGLPIEMPYVKRSKKLNDMILFISHCMLMHNIRIESSLRASSCITYLRNKKLFWSFLNDSILDKMFYRPYPEVRFENQMIFNEKKWIQAHYPNIKLSAGSLDLARSQCALIVIDYPGTEFYHAIGSGIPLIGYWDFDDWSLSDEAQPYFDLLKKAGVIFDNPESAAKKLNEVEGDIIGWWNSLEVQVAVKSFSRQYSRRSKYWWFSWVKAFLKMR